MVRGYMDFEEEETFRERLNAFFDPFLPWMALWMFAWNIVAFDIVFYVRHFIN